MARNSNKSETVESVESAEVESVETPVAEAAEAPAEETPVDLSTIEASVTEALTYAEESSGELNDKAIEGVRLAYQALPDLKSKNAAKRYVSDKMTELLTGNDLNGAKACMKLQSDALVAAKSSGKKVEKVVDHKGAFIDRVATLTLALYLAQRAVPEGEDAEALVAEATAKANEAFPVAEPLFKSEGDEKIEDKFIAQAIKIAGSKRKTATPFTGERRDLGSHISQAVASVPVGSFISVAEIRKFKSDIYGDAQPSSGAISNRLQPTSGSATTVPNITVETRDGKLGAVRTA